MYFSILPRAPTWYWVSFLDLQFQTERQPSFLLKKGYRFSICYRFHFTSESAGESTTEKAQNPTLKIFLIYDKEVIETAYLWSARMTDFPCNVYWICTLYASSSVMEIPPL